MTSISAATNHTGKGPAQAGLSRPPKIQPWHLDRLAIVYVRQSTAQQVAENRESTERQYARVRRAAELGWPAGPHPRPRRRSGQEWGHGRGAARVPAAARRDRPGPRRADPRAGDEPARPLVQGLTSAYSNVCDIPNPARRPGRALRPTDQNARPLLGLTGIMCEAELHVLRGRMRQGLLNKVRRGEVFMEPSAGYIRSPEGGFDFDPDEQARAVVRLVFDQFEHLGTVRKALRYLFANDIRLSIRPLAGPNRGQLEWRLPTRGTVTEC